MRILLLRILLLRFFKTNTVILLMRFYGLFILLVRSLAKNLAKSCISQGPSVVSFDNTEILIRLLKDFYPLSLDYTSFEIVSSVSFLREYCKLNVTKLLLTQYGLRSLEIHRFQLDSLNLSVTF